MSVFQVCKNSRKLNIYDFCDCFIGMRPINGMYPACKYALTAITECIRQELIYKESEIKISVRNAKNYIFKRIS